MKTRKVPSDGMLVGLKRQKQQYVGAATGEII